jgi:AcrR family transcriptional regulator
VIYTEPVRYLKRMLSDRNSAFKRYLRFVGFTMTRTWRTNRQAATRGWCRVSAFAFNDSEEVQMPTTSQDEKIPRKTTVRATPKRMRDPVQTQAKILAAAKAEFSKVGLGGARIESIAEKAGVNKRMIYEYFKGKEELFQAVLEEAWTSIRTAESELELDHLAPVDAIRELMKFTWDYYLKHPEFMSLVNSENLHRARHVKKSKRFRELHTGFIDMLQRILDRGVESGDFRSGVDARQLHLTLAAVGYYYLTNRHTGEVIFGFDFLSKEALQARLEFNIDTVLSVLRPR